MLRYRMAASCCGVWIGERFGRPTSPTRVSGEDRGGPAGCTAASYGTAASAATYAHHFPRVIRNHFPPCPHHLAFPLASETQSQAELNTARRVLLSQGH